MYLSSPVSVLSSKTSSIYLLPNGASYLCICGCICAFNCTPLFIFNEKIQPTAAIGLFIYASSPFPPTCVAFPRLSSSFNKSVRLAHFVLCLQLHIGGASSHRIEMFRRLSWTLRKKDLYLYILWTSTSDVWPCQAIHDFREHFRTGGGYHG